MIHVGGQTIDQRVQLLRVIYHVGLRTGPV
jgi:hypothetical protein